MKREGKDEEEEKEIGKPDFYCNGRDKDSLPFYLIGLILQEFVKCQKPFSLILLDWTVG